LPLLRKTLLFAVLVGLPLAGGCSDDPPASSPFGPGSGQPGADGGDETGPNLFGDAGPGGFDAADPPKDAGFRDPQNVDGGCTAPNQVCGGKCVSIGTDVANCGACGTACAGDGAYCNAGRCACVGPLVDYCAGNGCQDVSSDVNNCGACGNVCDPNQFNDCSAGVCDQQ
jgi:hypothetical protein